MDHFRENSGGATVMQPSPDPGAVPVLGQARPLQLGLGQGGGGAGAESFLSEQGAGAAAVPGPSSATRVWSRPNRGCSSRRDSVSPPPVARPLPPRIRSGGNRSAEAPFVVGKRYWFKFMQSRFAGHAEFFAGEVREVSGRGADAVVRWTWLDQPVEVTRLIRTVIQQGSTLLTIPESLHIDVDVGLHRGQVRRRISDVIIMEPSTSLGGRRSQSQPIFSPHRYCLDGFRCIQDTKRWNGIFSNFLPKFDPLAFLVRSHWCAVPFGLAMGMWTECIAALVNLIAQCEVINDDGSYDSSMEYDKLTMLARCLPILILRHHRLDSYAVRLANITKRSRQFLSGLWGSLVETALDDIIRANAHATKKALSGIPRPAETQAMRHEKASELVSKLNLSKAMHTLNSVGLASETPEQVVEMLQALHPLEEPFVREQSCPGSLKPTNLTFTFINGKWFEKQLRKCKAGTAVDQWGWDTKEMWKGVRADKALLDRVAVILLRPVAAGYLPPAYRDDLAGGRLVAISKFPKPGIRPICIGDTWRRLVAKGFNSRCQAAFHSYFQRAHPRALQFAGNTPNGATNMFHLLSSIAEAAVRDANPPDDPVAILALDAKNAFNSLSRQSLLDLLQKGCESTSDVAAAAAQAAMGPNSMEPVGWDLLWGHIIAHYGTKGKLKFCHSGSVTQLLSEAGVHQGDPLGSTLFALAIHPMLIEIAEAFNVLITAYADNVVISGQLSEVGKVAVLYQSLMSKVNLSLNAAESEILIPAWSLIGDDLLTNPSLIRGVDSGTLDACKFGADLQIPWRRDGLQILGCPLGSESF